VEASFRGLQWTLADYSLNIPDYVNSSGDAVPFGAFLYASIDGLDTIIVGSDVAGDWSGIYHLRIDRPCQNLVSLVDYNTIIPGYNVTFNFISQPTLRQGRLAFFGSRKAVFGDTPVPGIFLYDLECQKLSTIVDDTTIVPYGEEGETFEYFSDVAFDGKTSAFLGEGVNGTLGVYVVHSEKVIRVVDTTSVVPGSNGTLTFNTFPNTPTLSHSGVAFTGVDSNSNLGLFVYDWEGNGVKVLDTSEDLSGSECIYLGAGTQSLMENTVVFYGVNSNEEIGLYKQLLK